MKAMNLVAASKLQKAKQRLDAARPMFGEIQNIMDTVKACEGADKNVYFQEREVKKIAYLMITSDRGLCGGYNINLSKAALEAIKSRGGDDREDVIITAGARGFAYVRRRGKNVQHRFDAPGETGSINDARKIGEMLCRMYLEGEIDEAYVIYTKFKSVLTHVPHVARILPIGSEEEREENTKDSMAYKKRMIYDPDIDGFVNDAVPMYINTFVNGAMIEATVCEWASRMTSMDSATNNAAEILEKLTLVYNRTRQGLITQEITEIVSGANALK
jgi:F-type H+-transporting ATPase subunit gamma